MDCFRVSGPAGTDLFIGGGFGSAVGITGGCFRDLIDPGEIGLYSPKTATGQPDFFKLFPLVVNPLVRTGGQGSTHFFTPSFCIMITTIVCGNSPWYGR